MKRLFSPRLVLLPALLICDIVWLSTITASAQVQPDLPPGVAAPPIIAPNGAPSSPRGQNQHGPRRRFHRH